MTPQGAKRQVRRRWPRRVLILATLVAALFLVLAAVAEGVRRSDLPRRLVEERLQEATGLAVHVGSLTTTWNGSTTAGEIEFFLPLERRPFLTIPEVHASHSHLVRTVLSRSVALDSIRVERPRLLIAKDELGDWNLVRAVESIAAASSSGGPSAPPVAPQLTVQDGVLEIADAQGSSLSTTFQFTGHPGIAGWEFEGQVDNLGRVSGQVHLGGASDHLVNFDVAPVPEIARALDLPFDQMQAAGTWRGRWTGSALEGLLALDRASAGLLETSGKARVSWENAQARLQPEDLFLSAPAQARATGGMVTWDGAVLSIEGLAITALSTNARLDGTWRPSHGSASVNAAWNAATGSALEHRGSASMTARSIGEELVISGTVRSEGRVADGEWSLESALDARASDLVHASVSFPRLRWTGPTDTVDLSHLVATVEGDADSLRLVDADVPGAARTEASGTLDLRREHITLAVSLEEWSLTAPSRIGDIGPVNLGVAISGDRDRITIDSAHLEARGATLSAHGWFEPGGSISLSAQCSAELPIDGVLDDAVLDDADIAARLDARLDAAGALAPLQISWTADIAASGASVNTRPIDDLDLTLAGTLDADVLNVAVDEFEVVGGTAGLRGTVRNGSLDLDFVLDSIDAGRAAALAGQSLAPEGIISADGSIRIPLEHPLDGSILAQLRGEDLSAGPVHADHATGTLRLDRRGISLLELQAQEGSGTLFAEASLDFADSTAIAFRAEGTQWPITLGDASIALSGTARGQMDPRTLAATADGDFVADVDIAGRMGRVESPILLEDWVVNAPDIRAVIGTGTLTGNARLDLRDWRSSEGSIEWSGLDVAALSRIEGLEGILSGHASIGLDTSKTALVPFRLTGVMTADSGLYRGVPWTRATLEVHSSEERTTVDRLELAAAGGTIVAHGHTTMHADERFISFNTKFDTIDLASLAHALGPRGSNLSGRLAGSTFTAFYIAEPHRPFGQADLLLTEADLIDLPELAPIYDALRIGPTDESGGVGRMIARMEGNSIQVERFQYFNRGVDVLGRARLHDIRGGTSSEISGVAVGLVRPFDDIGLPFGKRFDRLLQAMQSDAVSVVIDGTLDAPRTRTVPFSAVEATIGRVLGSGP